MRHSTQQSQGTRNARFTGSLYQLFSNKPVDNGAYVAVNGPWDTYGVVTSSAQQADGRYLNQIRGVPARQHERVVASF